MLDHGHFLARINAEPDKNLHREVYADWLEEQGHPGADLIRWELKRRSLQPWTQEYADATLECGFAWAQVEDSFRESLGYRYFALPLFGEMPADREDRWRLVRMFFDHWFGEEDVFGYDDQQVTAAGNRLGVKIPAALREWFTRGNATHPMCNTQDRLMPPGQWRIEPEWQALIFAVENQACEYWGILLDDLDRPDPPVRRFFQPGVVCESVSRFAILWILFAAKFTAGEVNSWFSPFEDYMIPDLCRRFPRADVPGCMWQWEARIYEGPDLILETNPSTDWLWVAARTEAAFEQLPAELLDKMEF